MKEAGEQASKAKGAVFTLKTMSKSWDKLTAGGWKLSRFEGNIPDIETGHRLDLLFEKLDGVRKLEKAVEMKNWSAARSITGSTFSQFKAYIKSGNLFEYYFSDGLSTVMKRRFQDVFKQADKVDELWEANENFFRQAGFQSVDEIVDAANLGQLVNNPILNFIK